MKIRKTTSSRLTALFFWFLFLFIIGGAVWHSSNQPIPIVVKKYQSNKPGRGEYWTVQVGTHRKSGLYTRRLLKNGDIYKEQLAYDGELYEIFNNQTVTVWKRGRQFGISDLTPEAYRWLSTGQIALDEYLKNGQPVIMPDLGPKKIEIGPIQRLPHW